METTKTILHIEDDDLTLTVTRLFLEDLYEVEQAKTSKEAMKIIKKGNIDLILMDIALLSGKNGLELTQELKASKKYSQMPIIIVTSYAFDKDRKRSLEAGCDDFLTKPFPKANLREMIAKYI